MKQYALYLKDLQTMGTRQEHIRKYFITLITTLFTVLSLAANLGPIKASPGLIRLVSIFGGLLCLLWLLNMISYRTLFRTKFKVLETMETGVPPLPCKPFTDEWKQKEGLGWKYVHMAYIDMGIALIFICLFCALPFVVHGGASAGQPNS